MSSRHRQGRTWSPWPEPCWAATGKSQQLTRPGHGHLRGDPRCCPLVTQTVTARTASGQGQGCEQTLPPPRQLTLPRG